MALLSNSTTLPLPKLPIDLAKCWTIYYRHGMNALLTKTFYMEEEGATPKETERMATDRAQKHCGIMGYRFHFLRPMVSNIEIEEGIQQGTIDNRTLKPREPQNA